MSGWNLPPLACILTRNAPIGKKNFKGVIKVSPRTGRPTDNPKTVVKRARMSEEDVLKLKKCCEFLKLSESEVLRLGIDRVYQECK